MTPPTSEEYEAWLEHPTTAWLLTGLRNHAALAAERWMTNAWQSGHADQDALTTAKLRAEAYTDLAGLTYEDACGLHPDDQPQPPEAEPAQ
jgi:hypothetical protein